MSYTTWPRFLSVFLVKLLCTITLYPQLLYKVIVLGKIIFYFLIPDISPRRPRRKPPRTRLRTPRGQQGGISDWQVNIIWFGHILFNIGEHVMIDKKSLILDSECSLFRVYSEWTFSKTVLHFFSRSVEQTFSLSMHIFRHVISSPDIDQQPHSCPNLGKPSTQIVTSFFNS